MLIKKTTARVSVNNGFPEQVLDVLPNPAPPSTSDALSRNTAVVTGEGLALLDIEEGKLTAPIQGQLTCGMSAPFLIVSGSRLTNSELVCERQADRLWRTIW